MRQARKEHLLFNKFLNLTHMNQDTLDAISKWHFWKMLTEF